jgi:hypothetical protein
VLTLFSSVGPKSASETLSERSSELHDSARRLILYAAVTHETARLLRAESVELRHERQAWNEVLRSIQGNPEPKLVLCAVCQRFRKSAGTWIHLPLGVNRLLLKRSPILISHSYCEECLEEASKGLSLSH